MLFLPSFVLSFVYSVPLFRYGRFPPMDLQQAVRQSSCGNLLDTLPSSPDRLMLESVELFRQIPGIFIHKSWEGSQEQRTL